MKSLIILLTLFFSQSVFAIVNIENLRKSTDNKTEGHDAQVSIKVDGDNGNTKKVKAGLGARYQHYRKDGTQFVVLNHEYGESAGVQDVDKSFFHYRSIWYSSAHLSYEAFAQLQSNQFTRLSLRALAGGGIRASMFPGSKDHLLYIGAGLFREKETLDDALGVSDAGTVNLTRLNTYLSYKVNITEHSRFANTLYYQPSIDDTNDYRASDQLTLQLDITKNLALNIAFDFSYDSRPPQNILKTDTSYSTGLVYQF